MKHKKYFEVVGVALVLWVIIAGIVSEAFIFLAQASYLRFNEFFEAISFFTAYKIVFSLDIPFKRLAEKGDDPKYKKYFYYGMTIFIVLYFFA